LKNEAPDLIDNKGSGLEKAGMKPPLGSVLLAITTTMIIAGVSDQSGDPQTDLQADLQFWQSFREALRSGRMADPERYRTLQPELRQPMMGFLEELRKAANWEGEGPTPEVFHVGNQVHYLVPLTLRRGDSTPTAAPTSTPASAPSTTSTFCFTLVLEGGQWYFEHFESIFIRLDKIGELPVSSFPDLPEERKAWMRDEFQTTKDVLLFAYLSQEKGKQFAFDWFKDGPGYAVQAQTWVPFVPLPRAFILYLCWDLSNQKREPVVLEKLSDEEARVRFAPRAFSLYRQTAQFKQRINIDDYRRLFETVWLDRAQSAGWDLHISYEKGECVFCFVKQIPNRGFGIRGGGLAKKG
jgi:hypothetical protein